MTYFDQLTSAQQVSLDDAFDAMISVLDTNGIVLPTDHRADSVVDALAKYIIENTTYVN